MLHIDAALTPHLISERIDAHWASQLPSAVGASLLEAASDYSHTNLGWDASLGALRGHALSDGRAAALRLADLGLLVLEGERVLDERSLVGESFDAGLAWLSERFDAELSPPSHELPDQPSRFSSGSPTLSRWFGRTAALVEQVTGDAPRCWPHHFDLATLLTLDEGADPEEARSIGVGSSPGDGSYDAPYLYVTPWPYPDAEALPTLGAPARWHTEGFTAAVIVATELEAEGSERAARRALEGAVAACRRILSSASS